MDSRFRGNDESDGCTCASSPRTREPGGVSPATTDSRVAREWLRDERATHAPYFGRSILQVVGSAVALPSTLASVCQPKPESSTSYFCPFSSVETYSGCSI